VSPKLSNGLTAAILGLLFPFNAFATETTPPPNGPPTLENWQAFHPQICEVDPDDSYGLRAVIFPREYETYVEDLPYIHPRTDYIYIPEYRDKNGTIVPAQTIERPVPDLRQPEIKRRSAPSQYIAFLDESDRLVTVTGVPLQKGDALPKQSTQANLTLENGQDKTHIWSRQKKDDSLEADIRAALEKRITAAPNCTYFDGSYAFETIESLQREAQENGHFSCDSEGGYSLKAPEIIDRIVTRRVVSRPDSGITYLKHADGEIMRRSSHRFYYQFEKLIADKSECDWKIAPE
jgi:hypothetical protein